MEDDDHLSSGVTEKWSKKEGFSFNRLVFSLKEKVLKSFLATSWAAEVGGKY